MASTPFFSSSFVHCPGRWRKPVLCFIHIIQAPAIGSALECKGPGKRLRRRSRRARPGAIQDPPFRISTKAGKDTGEKPENRSQKSDVSPATGGAELNSLGLNGAAGGGADV